MDNLTIIGILRLSNLHREIIFTSKELNNNLLFFNKKVVYCVSFGLNSIPLLFRKNGLVNKTDQRSKSVFLVKVSTTASMTSSYWFTSELFRIYHIPQSCELNR